MKGDKIPNCDHIARLCFRKYVSPLDGQIQAGAFMLGERHKSLSVNWMESLNCSNRENEIIELRNIYNRKMHIKQRDTIAVLNVGQVHDTVLNKSQDRRNLDILHDPTGFDPSHSGIYNLRHDDEEIGELILETVLEKYPVLQD